MMTVPGRVEPLDRKKEDNTILNELDVFKDFP